MVSLWLYGGFIMESSDWKTEEGIRENLSLILEATPDFVAAVEASGHLLFINPSGRRILGISQDKDVLGMSLQDFLPEGAHTLLIKEAIPIAIENGVWNG